MFKIGKWQFAIGFIIVLFVSILSSGCNGSNSEQDASQIDIAQTDVSQLTTKTEQDSTGCCDDIPQRPPVLDSEVEITPSKEVQFENGMVHIPSGRYRMGADPGDGLDDEGPRHDVKIDGFLLDAHEVTNAQFEKFVKETAYITTAERPIDWEEMKKMVPPGTPKPPPEMLAPGSLVFKPTQGAVPLYNHNVWWTWVSGADWKHPLGPQSSIIGKETHPVVQISWDDANAYAKWAGKRLPTEAEWEYAARGGLEDGTYPWGDEHVSVGTRKANYWEGDFPYYNTELDGQIYLAPVASYPPNKYGLYDMAGNVWEWCSDWYNSIYYNNSELDNPQGPDSSFDPAEPNVPKKVMRGGSFLCSESYCAGYRVTARMKSSRDSGHLHTGFRCARSIADSK
ncbi:MAG: sulfatase modifying factor 1 [Limisphaerales bacterium]|jgi:sulfatase modifying factor 1